MHETAQARRLLARAVGCPSRWSARLGGMTIAIWEELGQPTITELTGPLPAQAARLGALTQRYLHRVPRLRVGCRAV